MATGGKWQRTKSRKPYIRCRCGLIFIGMMIDSTWSAHTYECDKYERIFK